MNLEIAALQHSFKNKFRFEYSIAPLQGYRFLG